MGESALLSGGSAAVTQDTAGPLYVLPVGVFAFEKHTPNRHDPIFFLSALHTGTSLRAVTRVRLIRLWSE